MDAQTEPIFLSIRVGPVWSRISDRSYFAPVRWSGNPNRLQFVPVSLWWIIQFQGKVKIFLRILYDQ